MHKNNPATVLVVDDDPSVLCHFEQLLSANEYQPILAASGEEALDIVARKNSIDLVLTNIDMPGINGIVLAKYFCNLYPRKKFLFMSEKISPSTLFSILGKKVAFLNKPIHFSTLIAKIKSILS